MKIFLSSRYGRRDEMLARAAELTRLGHGVVSSWIYGSHESSEVETAADTVPVFKAMPFVIDDLADIQLAQVFIAFTERPDSAHARGGRHVEYGIALDRHIKGDLKNILIIGPRENIFYCIPSSGDRRVYHLPEWDLKHVGEILTEAAYILFQSEFKEVT